MPSGFDHNAGRNVVYCLDIGFLRDEAEFEKWHDKMPQVRRDKVDAIKHEGAKRLSLGAGILLYEGLRKIGIDNAEIGYKENQKPYIQNHEDIFFNLSHSGEIVACAFSDSEVGIDVEKIKGFKESLVNYVFTEAEKEFIESFDESAMERDSLYTRLWTMKESLMKFYGKGIAMAPKKIFVDQAKDMTAFYEDEPLNEVYFTGYRHLDYHISVCSKYRDFSQNIMYS